MKKIFILFLMLTAASYKSLAAPALTAVTVTLTDGSGQVWANASYYIELVPPFGNPNPLLNNGNPPTNPTVQGLADGTGTFNVQLDDNTVLTPTGSTWKFTLCPNASTSVCSVSIQLVHGLTQDLSASISADLTNITVHGSPAVNRAYSDTELPVAQQGDLYWRVSDNHLRGFDGASWQDIGTGGGGGSSKWSDLLAPTSNLTLAMIANLTTFTYGNATGASGGLFNLTDSTNNTGTNYLFRIFTATNSSAKAWEVCSQGTINCVEFNTGAMLQPIGAAQIIATQVVNGTSGIGTISLNSNGAGSVGGVNTGKITGNNNLLYVSENGGNLAKMDVSFRNGLLINHTGTTTNDTIYSFPLPPLDANTTLDLYFTIQVTSQGVPGTSLTVTWNGNILTTWSWTSATPNGYWSGHLKLWNTNNVATQFIQFETFGPAATLGAGQLAPYTITTNAIDTSLASTLAVKIQNGTNTDNQNFHGVVLEEQ